MTSRYRAAQRAVELVARLQDEGLTVDEIAAEMRRLNVSTRQGGNDPAADLCASVQDMVADFAKAMGQPPAEESALRARAEAAEQRAEAAEVALAAARAEVARLRAAIGDAAVELPVWPEGAYQTPTERDVSAVRAALYAALGVTQ